MKTTPTDLGTVAWVQRTSGRLSAAERRSLLRPLARTHAHIIGGRLSAALRVNSGRRADLSGSVLEHPDTVLTRAAEARARALMPPALVNHSYRTYAFGRALGKLKGLEVDEELLFAAALLHDTGLADPPAAADFTLASARVAREVADEVGLPAEATETVQTAITMHHTPGVGLDAGPVAFLVSAGAGVDVVGLRSWQLPDAFVAEVVARHPREGFKRMFGAAFREEADRVPEGRSKFLHRYGAFGPAVRFAPFES